MSNLNLVFTSILLYDVSDPDFKGILNTFGALATHQVSLDWVISMAV